MTTAIREQDIEATVFATAAQVHVRASTADLIALARSRRALDDAIFESNPPFFWTAEISSGRLDSHYTRMAPSTLRNYAADAEAGVAFQQSHNTRELSLGRSLSGSFVGGQGNGVARVVADFYTIRGLQLGQLSTDQLIVGIRSGIVADVSVGFYGGRFICSICGRDILRDYDCRHYPSFEYEVDGGGTTRKEVCTADVEDAHLSEVSAVHDGSTPGAEIIKAQMEAERGRMTSEVRALFEARHRIRLPQKRTQISGHTPAEENGMSEPHARENQQPAGAATGATTGDAAEQVTTPAATNVAQPVANDATASDAAAVTQPAANDPQAPATDAERAAPAASQPTSPNAHLRAALIEVGLVETDADALIANTRELARAVRDGRAARLRGGRHDVQPRSLLAHLARSGHRHDQDHARRLGARRRKALPRRATDARRRHRSSRTAGCRFCGCSGSRVQSLRRTVHV